jgi:parallel beta-helix repeat protein
MSPVIPGIFKTGCLAGLLLALFSGTRPLHAQTTLEPSTPSVESTSNDDTTRIQEAVDSAKGSIRFASGAFHISRTIRIDLDRVGFTSLIGDGATRIVMHGPGPAFQFIGTHQGTADPKTIQPNVWDKQRMPGIQGIEIVGDHPEADGIEATGTMQLTIDHVLIREARHAIHLTKRNRNIIIDHCHLYKNRGVGIYYDQVDLHQSNITGCHISYNAMGGIVVVGGGVRNIHIGSCDIEANMSEKDSFNANVFIDCSQGSTAEVAITGCTLQHSADFPKSANIVFLGDGAPGQITKDDKDSRWGHLTIADNILTDTQVNVHLKHARGATISGNSFGEGHQYNLLVEDCIATVIANNSFDRNPPYYQGDTAKANDAIAIRKCSDSILTGLIVNGVMRQAAAIVIEDCSDMNISNCSIFDSDGAGILLRNTSDSLVTGCLIRDRRQQRPASVSLLIEGGKGNEVHSNKLSHGISDASQKR